MPSPWRMARCPHLVSLVGFQERVKSPFLSRWNFERILDELATAIRDTLEQKLGTRIGCSLLYRREGEGPYYVGGSSRDRRHIERSARYYDLSSEAAERSFTGFALWNGISFFLDNFPAACQHFASLIGHTPKSCELDDVETQSYVLVPAFPKLPARQVTDEDTPPTHRTKCDRPPAGALRISAEKVTLAGQIRNLLAADFLAELFSILSEGRQRVIDNLGNDALAIADMQSDLLRFRNDEFQGLDQLAFHLQTLFGDCQCSIFIAHQKKAADEAGKAATLHLAATTALNPNTEGQHKKFRIHFFDKDNFYICRFRADGSPDPRAIEGAAKTELAYYHPQEPLCINENTGSLRFQGVGELGRAGSFLAIAIPSREPGRLPYGVIRIVREREDAFSLRERLLAAAIAHALTFWLDFFPRQENLEIRWPNSDLRNNVLDRLFGISVFREEQQQIIRKAEREFDWLLQKIFSKSREVAIKELYAGKSGSISLLVENDAGRDLILKCSKRDPSKPSADNDITREVNNYREFVEGKLQLNHNVIYPELIRETRNLIGFATSFLDSRARNRTSLVQFCQNNRNQPALIEWSFARVIERLVGDVWAWWYKPKMMERFEGELASFVREELLGKDPLFGFLNDIEKLDIKVWSPINRVLRDANTPKPSELWRRFDRFLTGSRRQMTWERTVTHGDAHGDNIFFDPQSMDIWIIDFARTARRVNIFDLAMLESDLKFRNLPDLMNLGERDSVAPDDFWSAFWSFERVLAGQETYERLVIPPVVGESLAALRSISKLVVDVRQMACQGLRRSGSFDDYKAVLLLLAFKYLKLENTQNERRALAFLSAWSLVDSFVGTEEPSSPASGVETAPNA